MEQMKINLACGNVFVSDPARLNLDYIPAAPEVRRANLLGRLPLPDQSASLVYSSHFLEHIPRPQVDGFLAECHRILVPGGVLWLVLPDLDTRSAAPCKLLESMSVEAMKPHFKDNDD